MGFKTTADHVEEVPREELEFNGTEKGHIHAEQAAQAELAAQDSFWVGLKRNPRALIVLLIVLSTAITNGIELSMSGSMLGSQAFCKVMGAWDATSGEYVVPANYVSAWTAAAIPGQFIGIYLSGIIGDRWGRRYVIQASMFIVLIGAIVETTSKNWIEWLVSKAIMGMATGTVQACVSTYVAEISPRELRGAALVGYQIFNNIGNLFSAVILDLCSTYIANPANENQYKIPLYIMIALPFVISIGVFTMLSESPVWLVLHNRLPEAMKALKWIYPYMTVDELEVELAKIQYTVEKELEAAEMGRRSNWIACFRGSNLRRTLVAMIPASAWVMAGNVMFLLTAYFFALAGSSNALQSTVIVQCTGIFFNIVSTILADNQRIGRWNCYMVGLFFQAGGMITLGAVGAHWKDPATSAVAGNLLIVGMIIANMGAQLGPQAVSYLYSAETGSARLRAKTTSISQSVAAVLGQTSGVYLPYMLSSWGCKTGFYFGGFGVGFLILSWFVVPDYTGRSHAQIDELFVRKVPARKFASTVCTGNYHEDVLQQE